MVDLSQLSGPTKCEYFCKNFVPPPDILGSGAIVSIFTGGAFFGAMFAGATGDWLGRRMTIMVGSIIFILGSALQTAATNFGFLYAGRAIAGLGIGFMVMIIPLYQAEIAHPSIRGRVTALQQFMLGLGALTASKSQITSPQLPNIY